MQHKPAFPILWNLSLLSLICIFTGCTVIGGMVGHGKDVAENRTRIVPVAEAASLRKGATVYLTIPNRETLKGRFAEITEQEGRKYIHLKSPDGGMRIGLDDVTEIAEDYRDHDKLIKGALIGGALDAVLIGGAVWLFQEINDRQTF